MDANAGDDAERFDCRPSIVWLDANDNDGTIWAAVGGANAIATAAAVAGGTPLAAMVAAVAVGLDDTDDDDDAAPATPRYRNDTCFLWRLPLQCSSASREYIQISHVAQK